MVMVLAYYSGIFMISVADAGSECIYYDSYL